MEYIDCLRLLCVATSSALYLPYNPHPMPTPTPAHHSPCLPAMDSTSRWLPACSTKKTRRRSTPFSDRNACVRHCGMVGRRGDGTRKWAWVGQSLGGSVARRD